MCCTAAGCCHVKFALMPFMSCADFRSCLRLTLKTPLLFELRSCFVKRGMTVGGHMSYATSLVRLAPRLRAISHPTVDKRGQPLRQQASVPGGELLRRRQRQAERRRAPRRARGPAHVWALWTAQAHSRTALSSSGRIKDGKFFWFRF